MSIDACIAAAYRCGLRRCHARRGGTQNHVLDATWSGRLVVAKARLQNYSLRLDKEELWLTRARELGIRVPKVLTRLEGADFAFLLLQPLPIPAQRSRRAADWHALIQPLYTCAPRAPGWGPLRADDRPRWQGEGDALAWYRRLIRQQQPQRFAALDESLTSTWRHRQPGLIHGDLHDGNRLGRVLLDWENVAVADPLEDACRLALAHRWPLANCLRAWGSEPSSPRAAGACLRSALESAAYPGPRQAEAQRVLPFL